VCNGGYDAVALTFFGVSFGAVRSLEGRGFSSTPKSHSMMRTYGAIWSCSKRSQNM